MAIVDPFLIVRHLARSLVDRPESVVVSESSRDGAVVIELRVAPDDLGKIIGRRGQTARALRTVLSAATASSGQRVLLNIVEN